MPHPRPILRSAGQGRAHRRRAAAGPHTELSGEMGWAARWWRVRRTSTAVLRAPPLDPDRDDGWSSNVRPRRLSAPFPARRHQLCPVRRCCAAARRYGSSARGSIKNRSGGRRFDQRALAERSSQLRWRVPYEDDASCSSLGRRIRFADKVDLGMRILPSMLAAVARYLSEYAHLFGYGWLTRAVAYSSTFHRTSKFGRSSEIGINLLLRNKATFHDVAHPFGGSSRRSLGSPDCRTSSRCLHGGAIVARRPVHRKVEIQRQSVP